MRETPAWELLAIILLATNNHPPPSAILISVNNAYHFIIQDTK